MVTKPKKADVENIPAWKTELDRKIAQIGANLENIESQQDPANVYFYDSDGKIIEKINSKNNTILKIPEKTAKIVSNGDFNFDSIDYAKLGVRKLEIFANGDVSGRHVSENVVINAKGDVNLSEYHSCDINCGGNVIGSSMHKGSISSLGGVHVNKTFKPTIINAIGNIDIPESFFGEINSNGKVIAKEIYGNIYAKGGVDTYYISRESAIKSDGDVHAELLCGNVKSHSKIIAGKLSGHVEAPFVKAQYIEEFAEINANELHIPKGMKMPFSYYPVKPDGLKTINVKKIIEDPPASTQKHEKYADLNGAGFVAVDNIAMPPITPARTYGNLPASHGRRA